MANVFCGLDFGTTNSSIALCDGGRVAVLPADARNDSPESLPSLLYISREGDQCPKRTPTRMAYDDNALRVAPVLLPMGAREAHGTGNLLRASLHLAEWSIGRLVPRREHNGAMPS